MADVLELSEFLISRLCHDMAGPVGAINNGVELLKDPNPTYHAESIDLIEVSAKEAVARLLYFRQAYGNCKNQSGISMAAIKELVKNYYMGKNITFTWPEAHGDSDSMQPIMPDIVKLVLNTVLIVSGTLIHGGNVAIKVKTQKNDLAVKIRGEGKTVKLHEYLSSTLTSDLKEIKVDSKNAQAYLTRILAKRIGGALKVDIGDDYIEILAD
jgi:histidine phosphotransferase ChpT